MSAEANLTPVRADSEAARYIRLRTAQQVGLLHENVHSWDAVARCLAPYHAASGATWWHVAHGRRITGERIKAVLTYYGKAKKRRPRTSIEVSRDTHALLNAQRQPGETWDAMLRRLCSDSLPPPC